MIPQIVYVNAHIALNQTEYQRKYEGLTKCFGVVKATVESVIGQIKERTTRRNSIETFLSQLKKHGGILTDFDTMLWHSIVDHVTVSNQEELRFTFRDGTEITA